MAKKKATMTLKDFHGGSIPSDLPLPSAPGIIVRPAERGGGGFDRHTPSPWGNQMGRPDQHRLRPGSAGANVRSYDDKTPFLGHNPRIGRNFDEDERKPLDGLSAPRRTISDESIRADPSRSVDAKTENLGAGRVGGRPGTSPTVSQYSGGSGGFSYASRFSEVNNVGVGSQNVGGGISGGNPNVWGLKKEVVGMKEPVSAPWSAPDAATKLAHASALEKVSSGRWHSKQQIYPHTDIEVIKHLDTEKTPYYGNKDMHLNEHAYSPSDIEVIKHLDSDTGRHYGDNEIYLKQQFHSQTDIEINKRLEAEREVRYRNNDTNPKQQRYPQADVQINKEIHYRNNDLYNRDTNKAVDMTLTRHTEKSLVLKDGTPINSTSGGQIPTYHRPLSPKYSERNDRIPSVNVNDYQPTRPHSAGKPGAPELQTLAPSSQSERPRLKLLPRSKPLDDFETPSDYNQVDQLPSDSTRKDGPTDSHEIRSRVNANPGGPDVVDRPKLNLKPRLQPLEPLEANTEIIRKTLFGGARPRELVLKERGIDDVPVNNGDPSHAPYRVKQESPKTETAPVHAVTTRYNEKAESVPSDHRMGKNTDRRDLRVNADKSDAQRRNWRSDNRKNNRELDKHHSQQQQQQQLKERPPSPETWRKPVEHPKPASPTGLRYGKAASALELAQAFSRSVSDPAVADRVPEQRGLTSRGQLPFSRLMGPAPRPQVNGY